MTVVERWLLWGGGLVIRLMFFFGGATNLFKKMLVVAYTSVTH